MQTKQRHLLFEPYNAERLATICGVCDQHLQSIETQLEVRICRQEHRFTITGAGADRAYAQLQRMYSLSATKRVLSSNDIHLSSLDHDHNPTQITIAKRPITLITSSQQNYYRAVRTHTITFALGPSGTGKTFLAVAFALQALLSGQVDRIVLIRPTVEAGEHLGFLPGDMTEKVDPYLRPFYDAMHALVSADTTQRYIEQGQIEIAPLAFMRGRTLSRSFILLDEAQNTSITQMKMLLTRLGHDSRMIITGDCSQIDLPRAQVSGLAHAEKILRDIDAIAIHKFPHDQIVRHGLIEVILAAYERAISRSTE